ncbi:pentatricopeptide repeat-containing protein [Quercus suber]|uniref:Pentatricopeptide repeat-containing protein n=1 Tax=Quercus suber TaxID=58331 RepID=A0AAW0KQB7_QUESU
MALMLMFILGPRLLICMPSVGAKIGHFQCSSSCRRKNLFCWNSVIDSLAVHGYTNEALKMFRGIEREKIKPNGITFINVLSACTHAGLVEEGRRMYRK